IRNRIVPNTWPPPGRRKEEKAPRRSPALGPTSGFTFYPSSSSYRPRGPADLSRSRPGAHRPPQRPRHGRHQLLLEPHLAPVAHLAAHLDLEELLADRLRDQVDTDRQHLGDPAGGGREVEVDVAAVDVDVPLAVQAQGVAVQVQLPDADDGALDGEGEVGL